jgi:pSer/pThr/pTyr-binding forkhead associated (FHA) protein
MTEPQNKETVLDEDKRRLRVGGILKQKGVLLVLSSNHFGKVLVLDRPVVKLGRQQGCDFVIQDPLLSREHCLLSTDESGNFYIEDLSSKNATFLNSKEVRKRSRLHYGDRILVGSTILRFFLEEEAAKR